MEVESYNSATASVLWMDDKFNRLEALTTALSEAVRMWGLIPTPHSVRPPGTAACTYAPADAYVEASVPGARTLWGVGMTPDIHTASLRPVVT